MLSTSLSLAGQTVPNFENGWKPYGSYDGSHLDSVNLMNGNLMLHAPLIPGIPQRGSLTLDSTIYLSSKDWQIVCKPDPPSGQACTWQKGGTGVRIVRPFDISIHRTLEETAVEGGTVTFFASGYTLNTPDGATHKLQGVTGTEDSTGEPTVFDSIDLTGYHLQLSVPDDNGVMSQFTLTDRQGNIFQGTFPAYARGCDRLKGDEPSGGLYAAMIDDAPLGDSYCSETSYPGLMTDSNGNQINLSPVSGFVSNTLTYLDPIPGIDTMGRTIPSIPSQGPDPGPCSGTHAIIGTHVINYMAPDGTVRQAKLCSAEIQIQTAFNVTLSDGTVVPEAATGVNNLHLYAVVSIVLADGSHWTFDYDNYGELSSVTLPTGGSISYTWTTISINQCGSSTPVSRAVSVRTLTDGQGNSDTWNYHWGAGSTTAITNVVTDPASNDTVHSFTTQGRSCNLFETSTTEYQGSQSAGQRLRETDTQFSSTPGSAANVFATDITTTVYPSGKVKKVHHDPDPGPGSGLPIFGNVIKELEYDWGQGTPGTLLRETDTVYQWQKTDGSGNRPYLTAHLLDLPASKVVISPSASANTKSSCPVGVTATANCMAETDYTYDEPTYLATPSPAVTVQHTTPPNGVRGNLTTSSSWLSTSNSFVSSHTRWYDTGEPYQKIDPLGHTTAITYDPAYVGAYPTQTCSPQTGSVTHCVSGTYDLNTGVLTSFTNENATTQASGNTPGDSQHTSSYSYDMIWRIKSALAPPDPSNSNAVEQNLFSYSLPNVFPVTATRQKSITSAFMDSVTSSYDGLARIFKTEHAMPSGSPATVVTTYDDVHEKVSVTNPYFSTADSTYGSATTQSDALGRATTITEQDGSSKSVSYNVVTPATVQGDCNTSIDEAGHQHRSCTDGLGRLVEVDEPNPEAGVSTATANVTINGHEQANPQPVVPGTGWVTISGNELPAQVCQDTLPGHPPFCHTVYDSGSVTITVNGYPEQAGYSVSQNIKAADMASTLAADFHNDPASPVDAVIDPSNAAKINFISRSQTVGGNYTLSVSVSTDDPTDFGAGSYSYTKSGATLTGGRDATSSPDIGNVTITVNGVPYTTSFGGSDTDGSGIASRLAGLISAGPYASATAVGTTVKLTSKTAGPAGNYSLSASYTWNSASFAQPSFTTAADPAARRRL